MSSPNARVARQGEPVSDPCPVANRVGATAPVGPLRELPMLGAVLVTTFLFRLPFLGSSSLWTDEMWSIGTARLPWRNVLWVVLHKDSNASLYYALLHMWLRLGSSEASVRFLSVLLGVIAVPVLYLVGNRLLGKPVGLISSLLLTVNKLHISQSQNARTYSLVVLLVTVSSLYFVRGMEQPSRKNWCGYVLASVLAIYAHIFAVLVVAAQLASLVFLRRQDVPWKRLIASVAAIAALASPAGILLVHEPGSPLAWVHKLSFGALSRLFWSLAGSSHYGLKAALVAGIALCLGYFGLIVVFLVRGIQVWRACGPSFESWRMGFVFSWLLVPILLTVVVSTVTPVLVDRYLIVCLPALAMVAAKGIQSFGTKGSVAVLVGMVGLAVLALLPYWQSRSHNREWQSVTGTIVSQARPGDAIIFFIAPGRLLFDYYRAQPRGLGKGPDVLYPEFGKETADLPPDGPLLDRASSRYQRVWLVLYHDEFAFTNPVSRQIQGFLSAKFQKVQESQFDGSFNFERVEVLLYANDRAPGETNLSRSTLGAGGVGNRLGLRQTPPITAGELRP
jgi:mannosyltransferase